MTVFVFPKRTKEEGALKLYVFTSLQSASVFGSNCNLSVPENNPACLDPDTNETGYVFEAGNGPTTGRCVEDRYGNGQCEIQAWCEVEEENDTIT